MNPAAAASTRGFFRTERKAPTKEERDQKQAKKKASNKGDDLKDPKRDVYLRDESLGSDSEGEFEEEELSPSYLMGLCYRQEPRGAVEAEEKRVLTARNSIDPALNESLFEIEISMMEIVPKIYRCVRVPAKLSLRAFVDKVALPVMGFCRGYHAYRLMPKGRKDHRICYGPKHNTGAIDMMHLKLRRDVGWLMSNDEQFGLFDFLRKPGDLIRFEYDLGDRFLMIIQLQKVISPPIPRGTSPFQVLSGAGACPPEDCGGMRSYVEMCHILMKGDPKSKEYQQKWDAFANAWNCMSTQFDPSRFVLSEAQAALEKALDDKVSHYGHYIILRGGACHGAKLRGNCSFCQGTVMSEGGTCGRCKGVRYCSTECQRRDWKSHKIVCAPVSTGGSAAATTSTPTTDTASRET